MSRPKTADFLKAMQQGEPAAPASHAPGSEPPSASVHTLAGAAPAPAARAPRAPSYRAGLKHFGGYLKDETLEKIALLRVRLKKDNSALIELAIDEIYRKYNAKRAFGDD